MAYDIPSALIVGIGDICLVFGGRLIVCLRERLLTIIVRRGGLTAEVLRQGGRELFSDAGVWQQASDVELGKDAAICSAALRPSTRTLTANLPAVPSTTLAASSNAGSAP